MNTTRKTMNRADRELGLAGAGGVSSRGRGVSAMILFHEVCSAAILTVVIARASVRRSTATSI
jgi:hypothetical protein